jgi:putative transposase
VPIANLELNENMELAPPTPHPSSGFSVLRVLVGTASAAFKSRAALHLENLALRHQLGVLQRSVKRAKLTAADRFFWARLSSFWTGWRSALVIVKPETVISWHRQGFRLFWTWKVRRGKPGRPGVSKEVRSLIQRLSRENPLWGAPRIHGELLNLGIDIGETSVGKYMVRQRRPPSQTWRAFLDNHLKTMVSVDLLYGADDPVPSPVRLPFAGTRAPPDPSLQRHGSPHR